jgi:UDP-N-acetylmuramoylalanine--D-glutamate ligase
MKRGYIVKEISSFMAYNIKEFKSDYSIFTNFSLDHLNWHPDISDYFNTKLKVIENTKNKSMINLQVLDEARKY